VPQFLRHLEEIGVEITVGRTEYTDFHSAKVRKIRLSEKKRIYFFTRTREIYLINERKAKFLRYLFINFTFVLRRASS